MENAVEALKMAGSVLLFVLALSVIIPLFGQARSTADAVMAYSDREGEYLGIGGGLDENFYFYTGDGSDANKTRKVDLDTIIPSIYRSYKENTKVLFTENGAAFDLYTYKKNGVEKALNSIDLKYTSISSGSEKKFIDGIVYGDFSQIELKKDRSGHEIETRTQAFERTFNVELKNKVKENKGLYDLLRGKTIIEHLGVYYQEDVTNDDPDSVPEADKDEKRVITYDIQ